MPTSPRVEDGSLTKGTRAVVVYPTEYSGSNATSRYLQGVECKTFDSLFKYVSIKPRSNIDFLKIKGDKIVLPDQIFDDTDQENLRIDFKTKTGAKLAINHAFDKRDLGQPIFRFHDGTPFLDHFIDSPVEIMRLLDNDILPDSFSVDSEGFEVDDAFIEPLGARPFSKKEKVERPFKMNGTKGDLSAVDNTGKSCFIEQVIEKNNVRVISLENIRAGIQRREFYLAGFDFYIDGIEYFAQDSEITGENIYIEGFIEPNKSEILPFVDGDDSEIFFPNITDNETQDMESALFNMNSPLGGNIFDRNHISCTAGFVYNNVEYGSDSVSFGGLKR